MPSFLTDLNRRSSLKFKFFAGVILLAAVAILFNEAVRFFEAQCSTWRT